ncbi:MAG: beta strand repeat-containing protein [bacterium]
MLKFNVVAILGCILGVVCLAGFSIAGGLVYSTYLGGSADDYGYGIAIDSSGNAYITGLTYSTDFPTTLGVYDTSANGSSDVFITKLNTNGTGLVYSTFLGGSGLDSNANYLDLNWHGDIAVDKDGDVYISGRTNSSDFPTTPNAIDISFNGAVDAFVSKLNSDGSILLYSTYLGGTGEDYGGGIAIDNSGNAYITGLTYSSDFPTTPSAFDPSFNGVYDAFVSKLNADATELVYSTYLGGSTYDWGQDIAVDSSDNAYVTGFTYGGFPVTPGAYDITHNGSYEDVFVTKLNADGSVLLYSTYIGGSVMDYAMGIAIDGLGNAYLSGNAHSDDYPTTPGAYDTSFNGGGSDVFITKLNPAGADLVYSTYLGGSSSDWGYGIAIDNSGNAYVTGVTYSVDFPTTLGAFETSYKSIFVSKLNANGTALDYSTFLGGGGGGDAIAVDDSGIAYITGWTSSPDFPTTSDAFDTSANGSYDAFVTKLIPVSSYVAPGQLFYSTLLGGSGDDNAFGIALDTVGNAYIIGDTNSLDFPTTVGAFDTILDLDTAKTDTFITKLNTTGTDIVYSTFIGGSDSEHGASIALDQEKNVYLTGYTNSTDFPITATAFDTTYHNTGAYISKLSADGSELLYSAILAGAQSNEIVVDDNGNAYIAGITGNPNFPITPYAFQTTIGYTWDGFVSKLNTLGSGATSLVYSTFLGGNGEDASNAIAIDNAGNAYITGRTYSTDFPTTPEAYDTTRNYRPWFDCYLTKLNQDGSALIYSTYLGGNKHDEGFGIAVDGSGNAYITGFTSSENFPTIPPAQHTDDTRCFITKFNAIGSALVYSTLLGNDYSYGNSIALDKTGSAVITGYTMGGLQTTIGAYDTDWNGGSIYNFWDAFITKLNATGSALLYSTFLGGSGGDHGQGIALDQEGNAYIAGYTESSTDFPTTSGSFDTTFNGGRWDAFVTKMSLGEVNRNRLFTSSRDTTQWMFEKYGDGTDAGSLSWIDYYNGQSGIVQLTQSPGEKGKLTQVFSVPTPGWYTAVAKVATDIGEVSQQQKVYLYLQELNNETKIRAAANQVIAAGNGGFEGAGIWKDMQISFYAQSTLLGIQLVGINPAGNTITGSLYIDDIEVYLGAPQPQTELAINNASFDNGTTDWVIQPYADAISAGQWDGWEGLLLGAQSAGDKARISQMVDFTYAGQPVSGSVWVYSGAASMSETQKVYLYLYSYDSGYGKVIESGNAILQPGKWVPGEWHQLQFGCLPFTAYNAVQLVAINPLGNPYQAVYFDNLEIKQ